MFSNYQNRSFDKSHISINSKDLTGIKINESYCS